MATRQTIPIIHYDTERVSDDRPGAGPDANADFDEVRNRLFDVLYRHGAAGPDFRKKKINDGSDDWVYFVVESIYNSERYHYVEIMRPEGVTREWLRDLMRFLRTAPHWGICICSLSDGYALILADRIMVTGRDFEGCKNVNGFLDQLRQAVTIEQMINHCKTDTSLRKLGEVPGIENRRLFLRNLDLVTDRGLAVLGRLKGAVWISLADSKITDVGLAHLGGLTNLEDLHLYNCSISDAGVAHLTGLSRLKSLDLSGTRVTDAGLTRLLALPGLRKSDVSETGVTIRAIKRLRRALPECEIRREEASDES